MYHGITLCREGSHFILITDGVDNRYFILNKPVIAFSSVYVSVAKSGLKHLPLKQRIVSSNLTRHQIMKVVLKQIVTSLYKKKTLFANVTCFLIF